MEISELHGFITYELLIAEPPIDATSVESTIKLHKVTDENKLLLRGKVFLVMMQMHMFSRIISTKN